MSRPRANCYKIDRIEYAEKPGLDPDMIFIAVYIIGAALTIAFVLWSFAS